MAEFEMKANDTLPMIEALLTYADNTVPSLAGATVSFVMARVNPGGGLTIVVNQPATIVSATASEARVRYPWTSADTAQPGTYRGEWEVVFSNGKKQTFPTASYHEISILADLDVE